MAVKLSELDQTFISDTLAKLDFVRWDRYVEAHLGVMFYGWIPRDDGKNDFVIVVFEKEQYWYVTSSKKYTKEICRLIIGDPTDKHDDCKRVEDLPWSNKLTCIKLGAK